MGKILSKIHSVFNNVKDARIVLVGLDAAGKTTLLYKFKLNETLSTVPTVGFNCEEVQYKNVCFTMWDIGGQDKIRRLWKHYYQNCDAVIFMVDSSDTERFGEAREELQKMMNDDELRNAALLVLANKQDLPTAQPLDRIVKELQLTNLPSTRNWRIESTNAVTGQGIYEGLEWLSRALPQKKSSK
jgi:small GTP-binding protein